MTAIATAALEIRTPEQIADDQYAAETLVRGGSDVERLERTAIGTARIAAKLLARTTTADVTSVGYLSDLGTAARWAQASEILEARMLALIASRRSPAAVA